MAKTKPNYYKAIALVFGLIIVGFFLLMVLGFYIAGESEEIGHKDASTFDASEDLDIPVLERAVFDEINKARTENGLKTLPWDTQLASIARARAQDMAANEYLDHVSPEGETVRDLMRDAKIYYFSYGENIFAYYGVSPDTNIANEAVQGWLESPGHRAIMLYRMAYTHAAVGVACTETDCYIAYVTAMLYSQFTDEIDLTNTYAQFSYLNDPALGFNYNLQTEIKIESDKTVSVYIVKDYDEFEHDFLDDGHADYLQKFENVRTVNTKFDAAPGNGLIIANRASTSSHIKTTITYLPG